ncbi:MAG: CoA transferase [Ilumatobacteraceae bacterium]
MDPAPATGSALGHVTICDLSGQLAGAGATRFLAAFGARVIRVEDPVRQGRWDILRGSMPYRDERRGLEMGGAFNNHNVGKLGVTINLRTDRGRELLTELVAVSDVVTENFASGVMDRLGFGYERLAEIRPDIVYVSNSGFGHVGPYAQYKTFGPIVQACCGLTAASGLAGQPPAGWGFSYMDHLGGAFMATAVLTALVHRARTGEGQWVDMSCTEAGLGLAGPDLLDAVVNDRPMRRDGFPDSNRSRAPAMAPHGIYPTAGDDEWVAIACRDDEDWRQVADHIGEPWTSDPRWTSLDGRLLRQDDLDASIADWTQRQDRSALAAALVARGVPAAVVARPEDRIDHDPVTAAWGLWPTVSHPEMGDVRVDGLPVHLSETDWRIERSAPTLGQHNEYVFGAMLGRSAEDLERLAADGDI